MEGEKVSTQLPADITTVRVTSGECFGFLCLAVDEGSLYYRVGYVRDGARLEPVAQITMSEEEYLKCWGNRLGVVVRRIKRRPAIEKLNRRVVSFTEPIYALFKIGTRLQRIFIEATAIPIAKCIYNAVPEAKAILDLGSFVAPVELVTKHYYSLIDRDDMETLYELRKHATRTIPTAERIKVSATPQDITKMVIMREQGATLEEIGEATGFTASAVSKILIREGYTP
jgi:hypothetical protein